MHALGAGMRLEALLLTDAGCRQRAPSDASPETVLEPPSTSDNFVPSTLILSKASAWRLRECVHARMYLSLSRNSSGSCAGHHRRWHRCAARHKRAAGLAAGVGRPAADGLGHLCHPAHHRAVSTCQLVASCQGLGRSWKGHALTAPQRVCRLSARENTPSYVELVHKLLGHPTGLALEVAVVAFGVGALPSCPG